ncbi:MAG: ANTAR domain-containing protein, partial [Streptosporangiaceae bacterium]
MAQSRCDPGQAFAILRRASNNRNVKLRPGPGDGDAGRPPARIRSGPLTGRAVRPAPGRPAPGRGHARARPAGGRRAGR